MKYLCLIVPVLIVLVLLSIYYQIRGKTQYQYLVNYNKTIPVEFIPQKKEEKSPKKNILVYQSGSYDKTPEFVELSKKIIQKYCDKWGYDYQYNDHDDKYPVYWLKTFDLAKIMDENLHYDAIVYMDCDAIFYDFDTSISKILEDSDDEEKYDILIGKDPTINRFINTGVFMVRNRKSARDLVDEWKNMCIDDNGKLINNCSHWKFDKNHNKKWECPGCSWAGIAYEQGSLEKLWEDNKEKIGILNTKFLSNQYPEIQSYVLHLMQHDEEKRNNIFKKYLQKIPKDPKPKINSGIF